MIKLELNKSEVDLIIKSLKETAEHRKHQSQDQHYSVVGRQRKREECYQCVKLAETITMLMCSQG